MHGDVRWWVYGDRRGMRVGHVPNWDRPVEVVMGQDQASQGVSNLAQGLCGVQEREGGMGVEVRWG